MLRIPLSVASLTTALFFAACGGKILDAPLSSDATGSPAGSTQPVATAPPTPTAPVPGPTPAGPLPSGPTTHCGLIEGDSEQLLTAFGRARSIGIYEVTMVVEECSGAGGLHMTLQRKSGCGAPKVVHFGEHACIPNATWAVGDRVVLGVAPEPGSLAGTTGWCLEEVVPWDGVARALRKLQPGETDVQTLARYGCMP